MGSLIARFDAWLRRPSATLAPRTPLPVDPPVPPVEVRRADDRPSPPPRSWTVGDLARISGSAPPFEDGARVDGCLTIPPGTIYLGAVKWWRLASDPRRLHCTICDCALTNDYRAIDQHVRQRHGAEKA